MRLFFIVIELISRGITFPNSKKTFELFLNPIYEGTKMLSVSVLSKHSPKTLIMNTLRLKTKFSRPSTFCRSRKRHLKPRVYKPLWLKLDNQNSRNL